MKKGWVKCTCNAIADKLFGSIRDKRHLGNMYIFFTESKAFPLEHENYPEKKTWESLLENSTQCRFDKSFRKVNSLIRIGDAHET